MWARKRKSPMKAATKGIVTGMAGVCIAGIVVVMRRRRRKLLLRGTGSAL
ncbi:exonuclease VII large subunit [Actinopolymorpha pittospori]|uniref:Exonuclease VII large subunit n=1 Tax=Actinopolymorpha pittospori TaxID=648752 RepID=A0A927MQS8_9ACTN|nr:exonuclease VII large subunit [Actinopolymorpha pittospori]